MNEGILSSCTKLSQCEEVLSKLVEPGELLGRIPISAADWQRLGTVFKKIITSQGESDGTNKIWANYPTCGAVYLVQAGIRFYRSGEFWPNIYEDIKITGKTSNLWGQRFIAFLNQRGLPNFADSGGYRFITPILGHGGIPSYCLPDFFKYVLSKAVDSLEFNHDELLHDLVDNAKFFIDKPVLRFLRSGGDYALDFLGRCLEMVNAYRHGELAENQNHLGLPRRIIREYLDWAQNEVAATSEEQTQYFRSPSLKYYPYGLGVVVSLPGQKFSKSFRLVHWKIVSDRGFMKKVKCVIHFLGSKCEIKEQEVPLLPAGKYEITLVTDDVEIRQWIFLTPQDKAYMAFNSDNGKYIRSEGLAGEGCWLIIKNGWQLQESQTRIIEELPPLGVGWQDYRGILVSFGSAPHVALLGPQGEEHIVPILNRLVKPRLVGGRVFAESDQSDCLIYSGELPAIRFPGPAEHFTLWEWWGRWKIAVFLGECKEATKLLSLADFTEHFVNEEGNYLLPLGVSDLLPRKIGRIHLKIKGPMGYDANLQLIAFPEVDLRVSAENLWPVGVVGSPQVQYTWIMDKEYNLSPLPRCGRIREQREIARGKIALQGELLKNASAIQGQLHCGPTEAYYFSKNIRPIQWGWLGLGQGATVQWETTLRKITLPEWEEYPDSTLVLRFTEEITGAWRAELTLRDAAQREISKIPFDLQKATFYKFTLTRWKDAVKHANSTALRLWLRVFDERKLITEFCPAEVIKQWEVSNVQVLPGDLKGNQFTECFVCWDENFAISNKELRVWSVWRPWEDPQIYPIEGDESKVSIPLGSGALLPGVYRFEVGSRLEQDEFSEVPVSYSFPCQGQQVKDLKVRAKEWYPYLKELPQNLSGDLEYYLAQTYPNRKIEGYGREINLVEIDLDQANQLIHTCQMLVAESSAERICDFIRYLKPYLLEENYPFLLKAVAHWVSQGKELAKAVPIILGMDLLDKNVDLYQQLQPAEAESLWNYWPPVGFLTELAGGSYDSLYHNMERYFTRRGLEDLFNRSFEPPAKGENQPECQESLKGCLTRLFSLDCNCRYILPQIPISLVGDFQSANIFAQRSAEELTAIYEDLNLFPEGYLHKDFIANEICSWLMKIKVENLEEKFSQLTEKYVNMADLLVEEWQREEILNAELLKTLQYRRYLKKGTLAFVNFPYLVGFCALARRLQAKGYVKLADSPWNELMVEIMHSCPELYGHDLCLFELVLDVWP